jgi:hypothetical protein
MRRLGGALALFVALGACSDRAAPPAATTHGALEGGVVARVGAVTISPALVAQVAAAKRVEPRVALDDLIADALAAQGAEAQKLDRTPAVAWALRSVRAKLTAERAREAARSLGPPTDAEIAEASEVFWREVAMPERVRVVHAIALRKEGDLAAAVKAKAVANALHAAVAASTSPEDFEEKAKAVPHEGVEVVVQRLPAFIADGRTAEGAEQIMDPAFTAAAFKLAPGEVSGVVESKSGFHVIRSIERLPANIMSMDARRARFADDALRVRAKRDLEARINAWKKSLAVEISPAVDALLNEAAAPAAP